MYPSQRRKPQTWRTREDPFDEVFESEVAPLLAADHSGVLEATTLLAELHRRHPGAVQRRAAAHAAAPGPPMAGAARSGQGSVLSRRSIRPGAKRLTTSPTATELGVTITGAPFDHLLFELVLSFSGWRWPTVALSESFEALALGVQEALWQLGGVVEVLRSDNLSAATHELPLSGGRALTKRYRALLEHYGMKSTRIFPRKAHENGVVEQAHRRTKSMLAQMLVLRGSRDFP